MATMSWIYERRWAVPAPTEQGLHEEAGKPLAARSTGRGVQKAGREKTSRRRFFCGRLTEERQDYKNRAGSRSTQATGERGTHLCFGRKSLDLLDEKSVRFHHHHQGHACSLLDTTQQARVVHHLRPLTKGRRRLTAAVGTAEDKGGQSGCHSLSHSSFLDPKEFLTTY